MFIKHLAQKMRKGDKRHVIPPLQIMGRYIYLIPKKLHHCFLPISKPVPTPLSLSLSPVLSPSLLPSLTSSLTSSLPLSLLLSLPPSLSLSPLLFLLTWSTITAWCTILSSWPSQATAAHRPGWTCRSLWTLCPISSRVANASGRTSFPCISRNALGSLKEENSNKIY